MASRLSFERYDERYLERSWQWLNDPEVKRLTMTPDFTRVAQLSWFARLPEMIDYLIWGISYDGMPIGALGLKHVTKDDAEYWGYVGDCRYWGRGFGAEMLHFVFEKAHELGLSKLHLKVHCDNARAVRLYTKVGFKIVYVKDGVLNMRISLGDANES